MSKLDYSNLDQVPKLVCSNLEKCSNKILNLDKCTNWTIPILTSVQIQILTDVQIRSFKLRPVSKLNCSTLRTLCCLLLISLHERCCIRFQWFSHQLCYMFICTCIIIALSKISLSCISKNFSIYILKYCKYILFG